MSPYSRLVAAALCVCRLMPTGLADRAAERHSASTSTSIEPAAHRLEPGALPVDLVPRIDSARILPNFESADVANLKTGIQCPAGSYWLGRICSWEGRSSIWYDLCASGPDMKGDLLKQRGSCPSFMVCISAIDLIGLPRIACDFFPPTPTEADFALQKGIVWDKVERFYATVLVSGRFVEKLEYGQPVDWHRWSFSWRLIRAIRFASVSAIVRQPPIEHRADDGAGTSSGASSSSAAGTGASSSAGASSSSDASPSFAVYKNDETEPLCTASTPDPFDCQPARLAPLGQGDRLNVALLEADLVQTAVDLIVDLFIVEADAFPLIKAKGKRPM